MSPEYLEKHLIDKHKEYGEHYISWANKKNISSMHPGQNLKKKYENLPSATTSPKGDVLLRSAAQRTKAIQCDAYHANANNTPHAVLLAKTELAPREKLA